MTRDKRSSSYTVVEHLPNGDTITHKPDIVAFLPGPHGGTLVAANAEIDINEAAELGAAVIETLAMASGLTVRECARRLLLMVEEGDA